MENESGRRKILDHQNRHMVNQWVEFAEDEIRNVSALGQTELPKITSAGIDSPEFRAIFVPDYIDFLQKNDADLKTAQRNFMHKVVRNITQYSYENASREALKRGQFKGYIYWFDAAFGASFVLNYLAQAENLEGKENEDASDAIIMYQEMYNSPLPMRDQIESFKQLAHLQERLRTLLLDDPRGFSIIDYSLAQLSENADEPIGGVYIPGFMRAGALSVRAGFEKGYELLSEI